MLTVGEPIFNNISSIYVIYSFVNLKAVWTRFIKPLLNILLRILKWDFNSGNNSGIIAMHVHRNRYLRHSPESR